MQLQKRTSASAASAAPDVDDPTAFCFKHIAGGPGPIDAESTETFLTEHPDVARYLAHSGFHKPAPVCFKTRSV